MIARRRQGITNIEYTMIAAIISVIVLVAVQGIGDNLEQVTALVATGIAPSAGGEE